MGVDALVTKLEVTPHGELAAGFRGLGTIYFPGWKHLFPTKLLGRAPIKGEPNKTTTLYNKLIGALDADPELKRRTRRLKPGYWWVLQVYGPVDLRERLPKEFLRGNYTRQARWQLANPGSIVSLDETIVTALREQKGIEKDLVELHEEIRARRNEAAATRTINDLDDVFEECAGHSLDELLHETGHLGTLRGLPEQIIDARYAVAERIRRANETLALAGGMWLDYAPTHAGSRERTLRLEREDYEFLRHWRMPSADELFGLGWLFLDIEIPFFRREAAGITWVGVSYTKNEREVKELFTVHDLAAEEVNQYRVRRSTTSDALVRDLTKRVLELDPDVVSAYNAKFDLIKLRETEPGFPVGDERSQPLFKATAPFFERIAIKDRLVIDPMRWQKIARAHEINAKLELAADFEKVISYDDMEGLEQQSFDGGEDGRKAAALIARYLTEDVDRLHSLVTLPAFRKSLADALFLCDTYHLALEQVLHATNSVNSVQEKGFFTKMGVYRDHVPPHLPTKKMRGKELRAKEAFSKRYVESAVPHEGKRGLTRDVVKALIPIGEYLEPAVARRFPEIAKLAAYRDAHRDEPERRLFLEQYSRAFTRWIITDYGFFLQSEARLERLRRKLPVERFEDEYHALRDRLALVDRDVLTKLDLAQLTARALKPHLPGRLGEFLDEHHVPLEKFVETANERSEVKRHGRRLLGNFDVFPSRRFFKPEKRRDPRTVIVLEDLLEHRFGALNEYLEKESITVVAQQGLYLYLRGSPESLTSPEAPFIVADEVGALYNAAKPHYEKRGFIANLKLKDEPDYRHCVYEMRTLRSMLDALFANRQQEAVDTFHRAIDGLHDANANTAGEFFFFNKAKAHYGAYTTLTADPHEKTRFVLDERFVQGPLAVDEENDREYFTIEERGKTHRVYFTRSFDLTLNTQVYRERLLEKGGKLLHPVLDRLAPGPETQLSLFGANGLNGLNGNDVLKNGADENDETKEKSDG